VPVLRRDGGGRDFLELRERVGTSLETAMENEGEGGLQIPTIIAEGSQKNEY